MNLRASALSLLAPVFVASCSSMDMNGMDETFHNTPAKQAAMLQEQDSWQQARDEYDERFHDMSAYDFYRKKGYSDAKAQELANEAGPRP